MATNEQPHGQGPTLPPPPAAARDALPSLGELLQAPDDSRGYPDIAAVNLICASGLPGAGPLDVTHYLDWLDEAALKVRLETERNYYKFLDSPAAFECSQARFCIVCLVTVLQRQFGVAYNQEWKGLTPDCPIPAAFGVDASDLFIHAIIDGIGGTCGSLPVLYVAVGRRLGYPMRLVKAARHLFVRWDDSDGKHWHHPDRFNVEATGPGIHVLPDEHYRTWPHVISNEDVEAGIFLRSLSTREELAEFVATRGHCLQANGRLEEAVVTLAEASRLAPHNRHLAASHQSLRTHIAMRQHGHAFVNAPPVAFGQEPVGPFWMDEMGGDKLLVQIVSPVAQPIDLQPDVGIPLAREHLLTPNGLFVEAWLPVHSHGSSMTARWVSLPDGRYALVHKPATDSWAKPAHALGRHQPKRHGFPSAAEPTDGLDLSWATTSPLQNAVAMPLQNQGYLASQIEEVARRLQFQSIAPSAPSQQPLAMPAGPAAPRLSHSTTGMHFIT